MSLRHLSKFKRLSVIPAFALGISASICGTSAAFAAGAPVQTYVDQAVPTPPPPSQDYYDSPLAAGTLTLQDVLEAHRPAKSGPGLPAIGGTPSATATAPILTPPVKSSATGLMMSQGMKDVLQKVGGATVAPVQVRASAPASTSTASSAPSTTSVALAPAQGQPVALTPAAPVTVNGVKYEPGQEPRNLASASSASQPAPTATAASTAASVPAQAAAVSAAPSESTAPDQTCGQNPQKWEKTCSDAGYPANYIGKIQGETRTGCADGALHDVWVTNTCAPPDYSAQAAKADGNCGQASNNEFDTAPTANLCAQGIASAVSGDGPWTWACSGINGGEAAACTAPKRVPAANGVCGSANGAAVSEAPPSSDLCDVGTATDVKGTGPWTWTCKGVGKGSSQSCIAPKHAVAAARAVEPAPAPAAAPVPATPAASVSSAADKSDLCGPAAETLAYEAPEKDLCRAGNASVVNGDGPWTWSCTTNEGVTSSCRTLSLNGDTSPVSSPAAPAEHAAAKTETKAEETPATPAAASAPAPEPELACGLAAAQSAMQAPTSELCQDGKASAVRGSNPWRWTCRKGHKKISCETPRMVDGACGAANGTSLKSAPFSGLCASGTPSGIEGNGPWTWVCNGNGGGANVSCAASVQSAPEKTNGSCGSADGANVKEAPSEDLCATGTPSAVSGTGPWSWACSGSNGGAVASCSAKKLTPPKPPGLPVNGLCGAANGEMATSQPSDDLCAAGNVSGPVGNGPWNWSCVGVNGGMTVSCTAPLQPPAPIDGACGDANGIPTLVKPESGLCSSGILGAVNGNGPWTWTCSGANGGSPASCVAPLAGKAAAIPSTMTQAEDTGALAAPAAAPSGLVTPRLPSSGKISSLDKRALPSLTSSKAFATPPAPSDIPEPASVAGDEVSAEAPGLPEGAEPVQPPSFGSSLPSASVLQEKPAAHTHIPGNHLTLDPTISTVLFTHGSRNIDEAVLPTLDKLAIVLQNNPDARISLIAYADNVGTTPREARRMSLSRALAVRDYLSAKGISASRVDVHAEGANTTSGYIDRVDVKVND